MSRDRSFDLSRIDVRAAAQHHVGKTVAEIEITVGIHPTDIAERLPSIRSALRFGAEIVVGASSPIVGQEENLAALTRHDFVAVCADNAQLTRFVYLADRALMLEPFDARYDTSPLPF